MPNVIYPLFSFDVCLEPNEVIGFFYWLKEDDFAGNIRFLDMPNMNLID